MRVSPRACRYCGSPAKGRPCWWYLDHQKDGGDPPCTLYGDEAPDGDRRMSWLWWLLGIYVVGFIATFVFNGGLGNVTVGLALLRAVVWPVHWVTGWPQGEVIGPD